MTKDIVVSEAEVIEILARFKNLKNRSELLNTLVDQAVQRQPLPEVKQEELLHTFFAIDLLEDAVKNTANLLKVVCGMCAVDFPDETECVPVDMTVLSANLIDAFSRRLNMAPHLVQPTAVKEAHRRLTLLESIVQRAEASSYTARTSYPQ